MIDNYNSLPLGKFMELQELDFTSMEEIDIQVSIISILNDMTEEEVLELPITDYQRLASLTRFLASKPTHNNKIPKKIKLDGKEYIVINDIKQMTAGQYIDYQNYISQKDEKLLPYILSCFIIPKGEKYGDSDINVVVENIKQHLSVTTALSLSAFFLKKWENLTRSTLTYLALKMKMEMWKEKNPQTKKMLKEAIQKITTLRNSIKDGVFSVGQYK